jgi:outer membrane protein assembly factor BamA
MSTSVNCIHQCSSLWCSLFLISGIITGVPVYADDMPSAPIQSEASIEQQGLTIRKIVIAPQAIFDENKPGERKRVFRLVNRLHVDTRESTIRAQLLFTEGDKYSARVMRETERNLRRLRFLREPAIRVIAVEGNAVDLEVRTTDVWTLSPTLEYGRSGGNNRTSIGVEDLNFLGLGKQIKLEFRQARDRDSKVLAYSDPNLGFGRWTLDSEYSLNSDGHAAFFRIERPFFSLESEHSYGGGFSDEDSLLRRYALGNEVGLYRRKQRAADVFFGSSAGLVDGWVTRRSFGLHYEQARFLPADIGSTNGVLPDNRRFVYPFVQWEMIEDDFTTTRNKDQIGRTEDEAFGQHYLVNLGLAPTGAGNDRATAFLQFSASNGFHMSEKQSLFLRAAIRGRVDNNGSSNTVLSTSARYFFRRSERSTSYAALSADIGKNLDLDKELLLGGDNGLRAYPVAFQTGEKRALLTLEERYFTNYQIYHLFSVGGAIFADAGRVWGTNAAGAPVLGTVNDIGVGLRLGNLRSARANMLHIDFSWPLDDPNGSSPQFSVETRSSF